jgi:hypothetical protein
MTQDRVFGRILRLGGWVAIGAGAIVSGAALGSLTDPSRPGTRVLVPVAIACLAGGVWMFARGRRRLTRADLLEYASVIRSRTGVRMPFPARNKVSVRLRAALASVGRAGLAGRGVARRRPAIRAALVVVVAVAVAAPAWAVIRALGPTPRALSTSAASPQSARGTSPAAAQERSGVRVASTTGVPVRVAITRLAQQGLAVSTVVPVLGPPGVVLRSSPSAGALVQRGRTVVLFVGVTRHRMDQEER